MKIVQRDLLSVDHGVIAHQVNCRGRIGGGVSGAIIAKYPVVEEKYTNLCAWWPAEKLFGRRQCVQVTPTLAVYNCFTQLDYGNPRRTGRVYTDINRLAMALSRTCQENIGQEVWIPYGIGCGLGGANWEEVEALIRDLPLMVAKL